MPCRSAKPQIVMTFEDRLFDRRRWRPPERPGYLDLAAPSRLNWLIARCRPFGSRDW